MANVWQSVARNKNWRIGRTAPNNAVGANGEFWLNDATGDLYEKVNGVYIIVPVPGGGGGGAVDSVFGRTGHVVAQNGDYNATQVGLGNVTNDAQLKRAAGDFATFANKATPVGSDVILIEDSAASGAKKRILVSSLPTGGGAVDSVFGRTGHVVAQNGDYNATQVGLGNVTNDAQLKRAAGDFATFTAKPQVVNDDTFLVEDSAAAGTKKSVNIRALRQAPWMPVQFVEPPGGWDTSWDFDPMTATSPDLAANGWTVALSASPYTVLTRAGDVRWMDHLWAASATAPSPGVTVNYPPAAGTYYSTLVGGRLLIQLPGNTDVSIYRATTAVAALYKAGVGGGTRDLNGRQLYLSNGDPGATGVRCGFVSDGTHGVTTTGGALSSIPLTPGGASAVDLSLEAPAWLAITRATGSYLRPNARFLMTGSSAGQIANALIDTSHGEGGLAPTSRCALRLSMGPNPWTTELNTPIEIYYIRRRPARADAYF